MAGGGRNAGAQTLNVVRVLSLSTLFPSDARPRLGGFVARQFDALAARGDVDLTVICPVARQKARGAPRAYPVHYVRFTAIPKIGAHWSPGRIARAVLPLARKLHAERPFDLIDAHFFYPDGPAAAHVAKELGLPLSIKARGSDIHFWGERSFARTMMLDAAEQARGLLAVSEALRRDMAALGMSAEKIAVHYTGLDHALFKPRERAELRWELFGVGPETAILLSVGNLIPIKGHDLAIEAMHHIEGARLIIVGDGPQRAALRAQASSLFVIHKVFFASYSHEKMALAMAAADALVLPSAHEGLANVWIEALASGTPLVIPDVGGAREVVTSPSAGRLVERNPEAIARAVVDLLSAPPARADVAAHAARFSWEENAAQLAAHYVKVAGNPTTRSP